MTTDLEHRFAFHAATDDEKKAAHGSVRDACLQLAQKIDDALPDGREKSTAITKIEEAMFWGNAGLARESDISRYARKAAAEIERRGLTHKMLAGDYREIDDCQVCLLGGLAAAYFGDPTEGYRGDDPGYLELLTAVQHELPKTMRDDYAVTRPHEAIYIWNDGIREFDQRAKSQDEVISLLKKVAAAN